jgi:hypothetical protein
MAVFRDSCLILSLPLPRWQGIYGSRIFGFESLVERTDRNLEESPVMRSSGERVLVLGVEWSDEKRLVTRTRLSMAED